MVCLDCTTAIVIFPHQNMQATNVNPAKSLSLRDVSKRHQVSERGRVLRNRKLNRTWNAVKQNYRSEAGHAKIK